MVLLLKDQSTTPPGEIPAPRLNKFGDYIFYNPTGLWTQDVDFNGESGLIGYFAMLARGCFYSLPANLEMHVCRVHSNYEGNAQSGEAGFS